MAGFPARHLNKGWLKAGVVDKDVFTETVTGTPQGGIVSPCLLNIALHGMESAVGVSYRRHRDSCTISSKRALVRYADDLVIFAETREDAESAKSDIARWLARRGLELSAEKTVVRHFTEGFNFLGFNVRHYPVSNTRTGYKLLIRPSRESVKDFKHRLKREWTALVGHNVDAVLNRLRPILREGRTTFVSTSRRKHSAPLIAGCSTDRADGADEPTPPSHGNGSPGLTSASFGQGAKTKGCLETPGRGTIYRDCRGRRSNGISWFDMMRRLIIPHCAPTGISERPRKRGSFRLGDSGNWPNGSKGIARSATTACTTVRNSTFITSSRSPKAGRTPSQT